MSGWCIDDLDNGGIDESDWSIFLAHQEEYRKRDAEEALKKKQLKEQEERQRKYAETFEWAVFDYWRILVHERIKDALKELNNLEE